MKFKEIVKIINDEGVILKDYQGNEIEKARSLIRMERLKELLLQKEEYYNNVDLSDDEYYALVEIIDNIIINEFTVEEIDQAKKELNLD